jgi:hypothetical protein
MFLWQIKILDFHGVGKKCTMPCAPSKESQKLFIILMLPKVPQRDIKVHFDR